MNWKKTHEKDCSINYSGSSGGMESEGAVRIFERSIPTRGLKYTTFVGDGDSSTYQVVSQHMKDKYGSRYEVKKEECLGHVQKRMGNALRNFVRDMKGKELNYGKTVGGAGCLTKNRIDSLQRYYGNAIRENAGALITKRQQKEQLLQTRKAKQQSQVNENLMLINQKMIFLKLSCLCL